MTKEQKADQLSHKLQCDIKASQLVLSHTPMKSLVRKYREKPVLVIDSDMIGHVAESYGFEKVITSQHIFELNSAVWPFKPPSVAAPTNPDLHNVQIAAILMLYDATDWGHDLQIMCDVLRSDKGKLGTLANNPTKQSVPLYFSNSDFVWSNDYPINRLAQGAFRLALETIYRELTGHKLVYTKFGKPETPTYEYATRVIQEQAVELMGPSAQVESIFAIGDNPASDIRGANNHGWESILVKTGVWQEGVDPDNHGAKFVVHNVQEAVELAMSTRH
jgi:HAD superfamily hydrolase (TIGR01456 family)